MKINILILILLLSFGFLNSQEKVAQKESPPTESFREIFDAVELGIIRSDAERFTGFFGKQVYINIRGGESGYFSANQAFYILQNFLNINKPIRFSFTTIGSTDQIPFATGSGTFRYKGNREIYQIYVALVKVNGKWIVDKINFY